MNETVIAHKCAVEQTTPSISPETRKKNHHCQLQSVRDRGHHTPGGQ